jgi:hypothetical protein
MEGNGAGKILDLGSGLDGTPSCFSKQGFEFSLSTFPNGINHLNNWAQGKALSY